PSDSVLFASWRIPFHPHFSLTFRRDPKNRRCCMEGFPNTIRCFRLLLAVVAVSMFGVGSAFSQSSMDEAPLTLPAIGSNNLRVLSPTLVELVLINTKAPDPATVTQWNFVDASGVLTLPAASEFVVTADGRSIGVQSVGFKRRTLYAPVIDYPKTISDRDLRISNSIYLQLSSPIADNETVTVSNPSHALWPASMSFVDTADPLRWSPVVHVNQVGYMPSYAKKAMVGYFLGSMGEMDVGAA